MAQRIATRGMEIAQKESDHRQSRRMLMALILLLIALGVTVLRDRADLFSSDDTASEQAQPVAQNAAATPATNVPVSVPVAATPAQTAPKTTVATPAPAASTPAKHPAQTAQNSRPVRTYKAEVVHHAAPASSVVSNAAQRAQLPATHATVQVPTQTAVANYPLLDASTRVQGSVVLQAMISAQGSIEDLRVVSGPAILGSAARQAVMQWRFKPYLVNGRPVETQASITVNFTIRVADGGTKTAQNEDDDKVIILADNR
jgi:TonB family protein